MIGPSQSEIDAIEVDEGSDEINDFNVTEKHDEPLAQLVAKWSLTGSNKGPLTFT